MQNANSIQNKEPKANDLVIGGFTPLTTIDYPGQLSAVIFLQGCPWRCGYCQNTELLPRKTGNAIAWKSVIEKLEKRRGLLDAVVFSGGEPTLQPALLPALQEIRDMGFKTGLHSAGMYPARLKKILPLIDWIGFDIKAAKQDYEIITGVKNSGEKAWESARLVIQSGIDYEFRTTVHPHILNSERLTALARELSALGARKYVIQKCNTSHCLDAELKTTSVENSAPPVLEGIDFQFEYLSHRGFEF